MTRTVEDMGAELSRRSGRRPRRSGFTLIELLIANGILILVVGAGILAFVRGQSVLSDNVHQTELDDSLTIALSQITTELRHAARNTLSLLPGTEAQTLTFQPVLGWDAVAQSRRLGPPVTYLWELGSGLSYAGAELANNVDDNGNGLIDEGVLLRVQGAERQILANRSLNQVLPLPDGSLATPALLEAMTPEQRADLGYPIPAGILFARDATNDGAIRVTLTLSIRLEGGQHTVQATETVMVRN